MVFMTHYLAEFRLYFLPNGLGKSRKSLLEKQAAKAGAEVVQTFNETVTHVLVDDDFSLLEVLHTLLQNNCHFRNVVRTKWLSNCLKSKTAVPTDSYLVQLQTEIDVKLNSSPNVALTNLKRKRCNSASEGFAASSEEAPEKQTKFVCEKSSDEFCSEAVNHNLLVTEKLQSLASAYKSTNDKWRALGYEKAIEVIKRFPRKITNRDEVKSLKGIGDRLADKIWEICQSGELRKLDEFQNNEKVRAMKLFTNIWGVGPVTAEQWFMKGFRTLKDIEENVTLTHQQQIGLQYYEDFQTKIPRLEATEIVNTVTDRARGLLEGVVCEACGSYRRGRQTCGDVDILLTHPDRRSHLAVLQTLVTSLTQSGFLTDHLVECQTDGTHKKYMGVCCLNGPSQLHRRIDIISVPFDEYATSLIYFTGSAHFTRSIYAKAKSMGMKLNQHGLRGGVMRRGGGDTLNEGYLIATPTEESVFEKLGIPYRTPAERDHL